MKTKGIILVLLFTVNTLFAQSEKGDVFFITSKGKNGYITYHSTPIENNHFSIKVKVNWVDDDLNPITDDASVLVVKKEDLLIPGNDQIQLKSVSVHGSKKVIPFSDSLVLSFEVAENYIGGNLQFDFPLYYSEGKYKAIRDEAYESFQMSIPSKYTYAYNINRGDVLDLTPPNMHIISPIFVEEKPILEDNRLVMVIQATDLLGVSSVRINNIEAKKVNDSTYSAEVPLRTGDNMLVVRATDEEGNLTREELLVESVYFEPFEVSDGDYYALIIGVNEYEDESIVDLDRPIVDGQELYDALINNYTFKPENITFLQNPKRADIIVTLDELSQYVTEKDNLIIFYAGHGYYDEVKNLGYWLASDANKTNTINWIRNSTIRDYIMAIQSKHTLLIADACFSGAIFKSRAIGDAPKAIDKLYKRKSRKAMTSGTLTEVPDQSVFIKYLVQRLEENDKDYLSSEKLFSSFKEAVLNNSNNIPQYGTIQDSGDEGGDFIFIKRSEEERLQMQQALDSIPAIPQPEIP